MTEWELKRYWNEKRIARCLTSLSYVVTLCPFIDSITTVKLNALLSKKVYFLRVKLTVINYRLTRMGEEYYTHHH